MADLKSTTLPVEMRAASTRWICVADIDCSDDRARAADLSPGAIADLADAIERDGLMQPIGVKMRGVRYSLIWGRRRLEAYRAHADRLGKEIHAVCYPEDLPSEWARVLEIDENEKRQDLTPDERAAHAIELAAEIKKIESQAETVKSDLSAFTSTGQPTTGRGHKGIVQKVAERQKVDQAAVRKRAQKVAERIGEPVDLQQDSPAELERKAAKFRTAPKVKPSVEVILPRPRATIGKAGTFQRIEIALKQLDSAVGIYNLPDIPDAVRKMTEAERRAVYSLTERVGTRLNLLYRELQVLTGEVQASTTDVDPEPELNPQSRAEHLRDTLEALRDHDGTEAVIEVVNEAMEKAGSPMRVEASTTEEPDRALQQDPVDELREWAQAIEFERLWKHVHAANPKVVLSQLQAFIVGKPGGYHLRGALGQVRADLAAYEQTR